MPSSTETYTDSLTAARLIAYAAPTVALQAMLVPLYNFLPPVYYDPRVGLTAATVGLMFGLARFWEALTDPLIGAISDRTRSRLGRRRLWMLVGAPIAMFATWYLLDPPRGASAAYLLGWLMVFYLGWTLVYIPHQTWGSELAGDYHERTRIAGYRETGAFVGYLLATVVPLLYWQFWRDVAAPTPAQIVTAIGVFFVVALPLAILWCFAAVPALADHSETTPRWRELFAILRRNRPFTRLLAAYLIDRLAMGTYFAVQPPLIFQAYGLGAALLWIALSITIASATLAPLWVPIARRIGKHRAYCIANLITAAAYAALYFVPDGALGAVLLIVAVMGLGNGGTMILPPAMTADAVDHDEQVSGVRQTGGHMAFLAFVFKSGMGLGALLGLGFVSLIGYDHFAQTLDATVEQGVRFGAAWLPALLLALPIALMWRYPIDNARHAQIRAALAARTTTP
ncbi:MAG: MFS transporter [Gammaproteobacteria bacterium]|nr:MFS transporter [Gammaproteobacteria bacterium]